MAGFVGRRGELARLDGMLAEVRGLVGSAPPGRCVIVRGRRRIGKSALVEEFIEQQQVPSVFYTAEIGFRGEPLREFSEAVRISGLREAQEVLTGIEGIKFFTFDQRDVVRHPLVQQIVTAYDQFDRVKRDREEARPVPPPPAAS